MSSLITLTPLWLDWLIFSMGDISLCDPPFTLIFIHGQRQWHLQNWISLKMTSLVKDIHIHTYKHESEPLQRGLDCTSVPFTGKTDWFVDWSGVNGWFISLSFHPPVSTYVGHCVYDRRGHPSLLWHIHSYFGTQARGSWQYETVSYEARHLSYTLVALQVNF